jgi:phosphoglycerate dehydrogenase-like enzyme
MQNEGKLRVTIGNERHPLKIAVSGIPRGYRFPRADGNWLGESHREQILGVSPEIQLVEIPAHQVTEVEGIEVLLAEGGNRVHYPGELDRKDYEAFFTPSLRWVQICSTGFSDNITRDVVDGHVTLTNAPDLHTVPIAESVLAAMLDHAKNLAQRRIDQRAHAWGRLDNDELNGRTVLIIGLGNIGKTVARFCKAFGMTVVGTKRRIEPVENVESVFAADNLIEYLPIADYVVIAAPHTPETERMLDQSAFAAMKSSTYLVNVGRGQIIDEPALITALEEHRISGAYLDAFNQEPLDADHVLWNMDNVLIVPHDSHSSPYIGDRMVDIFCINLRRYVVGQRLRSICDPMTGY